MTHPSRGSVRIININAFYTKGHLSDVREGSKVDYDNLSGLFKDLRFEIAKSQGELTNLNADVSL